LILKYPSFKKSAFRYKTLARKLEHMLNKKLLIVNQNGI
jgi:hypothetical protein